MHKLRHYKLYITVVMMSYLTKGDVKTEYSGCICPIHQQIGLAGLQVASKHPISSYLLQECILILV